jgi:hypothetical protein
VSLDLWASWSDGVVTGQVSMSASRERGGGVGMGMVGPVLVW